MKFLRDKFKLILIISSIFLFLLVCLFGIIEYRWFNKIAENEYYKNYNFTIMNINKISNREFDRIIMFTSWLDNFKDINDSNLDNVEKFISNLYSQYYIENEEKNIIKSIGYININDNKFTQHLYDGKNWVNETPSAIIIDNISNNKNDVFSYNDNEELMFSIFITNNTYFLVTIDLWEFSNQILLPAIKEENTNFEITGLYQTKDNILDQSTQNILNSNLNYKFNPLSIILNNKLFTNKSIIIPITKQQFKGPINFPNPFRSSVEREQNPKEYLSKDSIMSYFEPNEIYAYITLKVNSNSNFVNYTEKTLSYIFIGGLFLLLLIGVICILSIYQMLRIKNQRDKEREFTASITHELRTPLTVIRSASDNLCENLVKKEKIPSYGQLIKQQAIRLNSMIENLLAYSKIEGNKFYKKNENKVNLKEFFETLKIQNLALSKEKDITINWIFKNLENTVYLDKDLLELVISNLISNSIFHAYNEYKGEIRIFAQFSKQKKELFCTIEDDGIGISIKEQKYIYNSYYRGEKSKKYQERGTGLGLFIVKRNVSILGGKIKLQSPYKRLNGKIKPGCHFELIIPCRIEKI